MSEWREEAGDTGRWNSYGGVKFSQFCIHIKMGPTEEPPTIWGSVVPHGPEIVGGS